MNFTFLLEVLILTTAFRGWAGPSPDVAPVPALESEKALVVEEEATDQSSSELVKEHLASLTPKYLVRGRGWMALVSPFKETQLYIDDSFNQILVENAASVELDELKEGVKIENMSGAKKSLRKFDLTELVVNRELFLEQLDTSSDPGHLQQETLQALKLTPQEAITSILNEIVAQHDLDDSIPSSVGPDCFECSVNSQLSSAISEEEFFSGLEHGLTTFAQGQLTNSSQLGDVSAFLISSVFPNYSNAGLVSDMAFTTFLASGALLAYSLIPSEVPEVKIPLVKGQELKCNPTDIVCLPFLIVDSGYESSLLDQMEKFLLEYGIDPDDSQRYSRELVQAMKTGNFSTGILTMSEKIDWLEEYFFYLQYFPNYQGHLLLQMYQDYAQKIPAEGEDPLFKLVQQKYPHLKKSELFDYVSRALYNFRAGKLNESDFLAIQSVLGPDFCEKIKNDVIIDPGELAIQTEKMRDLSRMQALSFLDGAQARKFITKEFYPIFFKQVYEEETKKLQESALQAAKEASHGDSQLYQEFLVTELEKVMDTMESTWWISEVERKAMALAREKTTDMNVHRGSLNLIIGYGHHPGTEEVYAVELGLPDQIMLGGEYDFPYSDDFVGVYFFGKELDQKFFESFNSKLVYNPEEDVEGGARVATQVGQIELKAEVATGTTHIDEEFAVRVPSSYIRVNNSLVITPLPNQPLTLTGSMYGRYGTSGSVVERGTISARYNLVDDDPLRVTLAQGVSFTGENIFDYESGVVSPYNTERLYKTQLVVNSNRSFRAGLLTISASVDVNTPLETLIRPGMGGPLAVTGQLRIKFVDSKKPNYVDQNDRILDEDVLWDSTTSEPLEQH